MKMLYWLLLLTPLFSCDKNSGTGDPQDLVPELTVFDVKQERDSVATVNFRFFINVSRSADKEIKVSYTTVDGSAVAGLDYSATSGVLTIAAGESLAYFDVPVPGKNFYEPDKVFYIQLSNAVNATIPGAGKATGTIGSPKSLQVIDQSGYTTPLSYPGYTLAWNDEFNTVIDPAFWGYDLGASGWGNNELENYTSNSANSYISNGSLVIEARKESNGQYTSARMLSAGKKTFKFGRIDIRAKLPKGQGIWPALWMLGANINTVGWPACGEIDIMELLGHEPAKVYGTAHWGAQGSNNSIHVSGTKTLSSGDFSDKFHVFSLIWENNKIRWYIDDVLYHTITPANTGSANYPFNAEFFFILNVAVGGNWPGNPDASTVFPQKMLVDYIRVFQ